MLSHSCLIYDLVCLAVQALCCILHLQCSTHFQWHNSGLQACQSSICTLLLWSHCCITCRMWLGIVLLNKTSSVWQNMLIQIPKPVSLSINPMGPTGTVWSPYCSDVMNMSSTMWIFQQGWCCLSVHESVGEKNNFEFICSTLCIQFCIHQHTPMQ